MHQSSLVASDWLSGCPIGASCVVNTSILRFTSIICRFLSKAVHTCDPLHPRGLVDAQVVVEDAQDVSQDDAEMFRRHHGAALSVWRRVFWTFLPPVGQIVTQHGEDDLDDLHRSKRIKHTSTEWKQSGLNM